MNNLKYLIYDAHSCPPFHNDKTVPKLIKYKKAGISFVSLNVGFGEMTSDMIFPLIENLTNYINTNPTDYSLISRIEDINSCKEKNKVGIAFDLEGANALDGDVYMLDKYHYMGVKQSILVYNKNNAAGGGCHDIDNGLTKYGKAIVARMNEIGMIVDCSHTGKKTSFNIMESSSDPVIFSHSNAFKIYEHERNISDDQIKLCADMGGVIGVNGVSIFLGEKIKLISKVVENIDYIVQLVGPDHVGIGLDYVFDQEEVQAIVKTQPTLFPNNGCYSDVQMLEPKDIPHIATALVSKGYDKQVIEGILGGNFLRIAQKVWK